jgi:hypothetical protein
MQRCGRGRILRIAKRCFVFFVAWWFYFFPGIGIGIFTCSGRRRGV